MSACTCTCTEGRSGGEDACRRPHESRDTGGASDRQQSKGNYEEEGHEEQAGQQHHLPLLIEVKPGNVPPVVERRHLQENTFASKRAQSLVREHIL